MHAGTLESDDYTLAEPSLVQASSDKNIAESDATRQAMESILSNRNSTYDEDDLSGSLNLHYNIYSYRYYRLCSYITSIYFYL